MQQTKAALMRQGVKIFLALAVLTIVEFGAAAAYRTTSLFPLLAIAFGKITLIVMYFMHAGKVFHDEEGEPE